MDTHRHGTSTTRALRTSTPPPGCAQCSAVCCCRPSARGRLPLACPLSACLQRPTLSPEHRAAASVCSTLGAKLLLLYNNAGPASGQSARTCAWHCAVTCSAAQPLNVPHFCVGIATHTLCLQRVPQVCHSAAQEYLGEHKHHRSGMRAAPCASASTHSVAALALPARLATAQQWRCLNDCSSM